MLCIVPADVGDLVLLVLHMLQVFKDPCVPGRQVELVQIFLHDLTGTAVQRPDMYVMGVGRRDSNKETASVAVPSQLQIHGQRIRRRSGHTHVRFTNDIQTKQRKRTNQGR